MIKTNERLLALAKKLNCEVDELNESSYNEQIIEYGSQEYLVVTDDEANELWEQELDNYIDECILPELPEFVKNYFDNERWKHDARYDGRGHSLSCYDGNEDYEEINGITYYIYRQN